MQKGDRQCVCIYVSIKPKTPRIRGVLGASVLVYMWVSGGRPSKVEHRMEFCLVFDFGPFRFSKHRVEHIVFTWQSVQVQHAV